MTRANRWRVLMVALTLASSIGGPSHRVFAQEASDTEAQTQQARQLFEEGLRFVESQQWQEAAERFGQVLAIRGSAIVSYNYASALVHLGRNVEASRALRGVVADPMASPEVVAAARTLLERTEPRIGQLTVRLRGDTEGVVVTIDDEALPEGSIGIPFPVDPGERIVRVTRGGRPIARRKVEVHEGSPLLNITIDVVPLPRDVAQSAGGTNATEEAPLQAAPARDGGGSALPWIIGGGVLAVGAVVVIALLATPSEPDPVRGNTDPSIIRGRVTP